MKTIHELRQAELEELQSSLFNETPYEILGKKGIYTPKQMPMVDVIAHFEGISFVDEDFWCNINFEVRDVLIEYFASLITPSELAKMCKIPEAKETELLKILREAQYDWDRAPCDEEGETVEQGNYLQSILYKYTNQILSLLN
jgi:hypothetical protein